MFAAFGGAQPQVLGYCGVFLATGIVTTLAQQMLFYAGAGETYSMLIPFFNYLGLAMSGLFVGRQKLPAVKREGDSTLSSFARLGPFKITTNVYVYATTALDIAGLITVLLGIEFAGSGLFQVISSSDIGWAALISRLALGSSINKFQWLGVVVVIVGLSASTGEELAAPHHPIFLLFGCLMSLLSAIIFALDNVLSEVVMSHPSAPDPKDAAVRMGTIATGIFSLYLLFVTLPNWTEFVSAPIEKAGGSPTTIIITYIVMMLSQLMHTLAYFKVLGCIGAVAAGILNGLRAVGVFVASGMFFCNFQESQCLSIARVLCSAVVVSGVFVYSCSTTDENPGPKSSPSTGISSPANETTATLPNRPKAKSSSSDVHDFQEASIA